jgi:O-antigen/teichoic acid export membrane protein
MAAIGIFVTIVAGLFFYWLRRRCRFWYGAYEIVVALAVIYLTFVPAYTVMVLADMSPSRLLLSKGVGILGGIYLIVRGMDNMDEDLPPTWRRVWDHAFPKRTRQYP